MNHVRPHLASIAVTVSLLTLALSTAAGADTTTTINSTTSTSSPTTTPSSTTTSATAAPSGPGSDRGPTVQQEPAIDAAPTAVTTFIVAGTPADGVTAGVEAQLTSADDLTQVVEDPSAALSGAVQQFFDQGGSVAYLVLTPDEQADTLVAASTALARNGSSADLFAIPAIAALDAQDYLDVATALAALADSQLGLALLDPPTTVVAAVTAAWPDVSALVDLASQLRSTIVVPSSAALYATPLTDPDTGDTVPASAVMAGLMTYEDAKAGVWSPAAGTGVVAAGLDVPLPFANTQIAALNRSVNAFRSLPNYGTVMWGEHTLDTADETTYISIDRTADWIQRSITAGLRSVQFLPNDQATWNVVEQSVSAFLWQLWNEGALLGATPAQAFQIEVDGGMDAGTTSVGQDVGLGVGVALQYPSQIRTIDMTIRSAGPPN